MADNQTPQAQYELPEGTGNNPQEDYNENWEAADHAGGWVTAEIETGHGGSEGEWYTFNNSGKAVKAQADSLDNCAIVFMLTEDTAETEEGLFLKAGNWWKNTWGLDPSKIYYLSQTTAGAWTTTQPASGLIIVLGRCDQDTETFHIAEGGGGGGGGLNDHATLTNLAWSVAGHTMDTTLDMAQNRIINITHLELNPQGTVEAIAVSINQGSYTANPTFTYYGTFQYINKTGGATSTAWEMTGHYTELRQSDAANTMGYIYGNHNILRAYESYGNSSDAMTGMWNDFTLAAGKTITGRVKGTYFRFHPEGTVTLQTYGTLNWVGPSSGGTLNTVYGSYQNIICATLGTINGDAYGHYSDMNISGTNRLSGDEYAFIAKSASTGVTGTSYAYYAEGAGFDYFLYCNVDTMPSYIAGVVQIDNTIWGEGTTGATPTSGAGTRFMWIPSKRAMRAGEVDSTQWDDANIGQGSFCFSRYRSTASGADSFVTGWNCSASGQYGVAMGYYASATGAASIALGNTVTANAFNAVAIGQSITAGTSAKCFGESITAFTDSTIIGFNLVTNTCYRAVYVGRNITGASGTNDDCYGFGQFIGFITGDDNWVFGKGVDSGNPLMSVGSNQLVIGMNSNLASIVIDGSSAGIGTRADVIIYGALTLNDDVHVIGEFYVTPSGSGINSEAYGQGAAATGDNSLSVGYQVTSSGVETVMVGNNINTVGNSIVAVGHNISGLAQRSIGIGVDITGTASLTDSVLIGTLGQLTGTEAENVMIGASFGLVNATGVVGIGYDVAISADNCVCIGQDAYIGVGFSQATVVGETSTVTGASATIVGQGATVGAQSVGLGSQVTGGGARGVAIGYDADIAFDECIAIGHGATPTQANEMAIGSTGEEIDHLRFIVSGTHLSWYNLVSFQPSTAGANSEVIGAGSQGVTGADTVAFGKDIIASGGNSVFIGHNIQPAGGTAANSVLIGADVDLNFNASVIIGYAASANQTSCVIGYQATGGTESVSIGNDANGGSGVCIGVRAAGSGVTIGTDTVGHSSCTIIGEDATRNGFTDVICIGRNATATQANEMMIGGTSYEIDYLSFVVSGTFLTVETLFSFEPGATPATSQCIGGGASASGGFSVALGISAVASATGAIAIGNGPDAVGNYAIAIGNNAQATTNGIVIGGNADDNANSDCIVIGTGSTADGQDAVVIGHGATNGKFGVVIGSGATSTDLHAISIGLSATADLDAIAIGRDADASFAESIAIGRGATTSQANEMVIGSVGYEIDYLTVTVTGTALSVSTIFEFTNGLWVSADNDFNLDGSTGDQKIKAVSTPFAMLEFYGGSNGNKMFTFMTDLGVLGDKVSYVADIEMQSGTIIDSDGIIRNVVRKTATYTVTLNDHILFGVTSGAAFDFALPAGAQGEEHRIVNTGSSNLTITPNGAELLLGVNAAFTLSPGNSLIIHYDTTEGWW